MTSPNTQLLQLFSVYAITLMNFRGFWILESVNSKIWDSRKKVKLCRMTVVENSLLKKKIQILKLRADIWCKNNTVVLVKKWNWGHGEVGYQNLDISVNYFICSYQPMNLWLFETQASTNKLIVIGPPRLVIKKQITFPTKFDWYSLGGSDSSSTWIGFAFHKK